MPIPHIPVIRKGEPYESLEKAEIKSVRTGETVALVSQANAGIIRRDLRRTSREALRQIPVEKLLAICAEAGRLFMEGDLPLSDGQTQSPQQYVESLSATSGLPH